MKCLFEQSLSNVAVVSYLLTLMIELFCFTKSLVLDANNNVTFLILAM